ncbi:MAG TPA: hypothetical protein VGE59_01975 [Patescibacteria group bacterium]
MVVQRIQGNTIGLKLANALVNIKHEGGIRIGDRETEGPGEYDIAGVGAHVLDSTAILFAEGIRIGIVWSVTADAKFEDDVNIDILIPFLTDVKQVNAFIKEQDPRVVVIPDEAIADEIAKQDGITVAKEANYKITSSTLPVEDRVFITLS